MAFVFLFTSYDFIIHLENAEQELQVAYQSITGLKDLPRRVEKPKDKYPAGNMLRDIAAADQRLLFKALRSTYGKDYDAFGYDIPNFPSFLPYFY